MDNQEINERIAKINELIEIRKDITKELEKGNSWEVIAKKFGFATAKKLQDYLEDYLES